MRISSFKEFPLRELLALPPQNGYSPVCSDFPTGKWILSLAALDDHGFNPRGIKPAPADDPIVDKFLLKSGDFLISRSNTADKVGRVGVFHGEIEHCSYPDLMMRFRPLSNQIDPSYLEHYLKSDVVASYIQKHATGTSGSMKKINRAIVEAIPVVLPSLREQKAIATIVGDWYAAIETTERLIAAQERQLTAMRDHLLGPNTASPVKLKALTSESTIRNGNHLGRDAIMGVIKDQGMRPMREETIAANTERYKVVPPMGFAYNPMRLNIGSIAMSSFDEDVLVSPDYVVFTCNESKLLPKYLNHLRFTRHWASHFEDAGNGGVRVRIYYSELAQYALHLPPVDKQRRIVALLDAHVEEIDLLKRQLEALRIQKRGLMQKLLTGQWRLPVEPSEAMR